MRTRQHQRAVGYARVSTHEQATSGVSLDAQENAIRAYCAMRGLELVDMIVDAGVSAAKPLESRDGGRRLLDRVRDGVVVAVVSYKLDRVFRDCADCLAVVRNWDERDVALHLVDLGGQTIDTGTAMGRFFLTVMAGAAELERNLIGERTKAALAHLKKEEGVKLGGPALGWTRTDERDAVGRLVVHDEELATVERASARFAARAPEGTEGCDQPRAGGTTDEARRQRWYLVTVARDVQRAEAVLSTRERDVGPDVIRRAFILELPMNSAFGTLESALHRRPLCRSQNEDSPLRCPNRSSYPHIPIVDSRHLASPSAAPYAARVLPRFPFVVLDMNRCRRDEVVNPLLEDFDRAGTRIFLPAISHWELSKGGSAGTVESSMRILSRRPEALALARHTYLFKRDERHYRQRLEIESLVDRRHTKNFQEVLRGLRDDTHSVDPVTVLASRKHWRNVLDQEEEPHVLRELVKLHRKDLSQDRANVIRRALQAECPDRAPFRAYLREAIGDRNHLAGFLVGVGYGHVTAKRLARFPSFSLLHMIALHAVALRWRILGGAATAANETLEAEMIDAEYAVLAAYGRDLVSADAGARATYEDVLAIASELWPT